jgi:hypothetical protein
MPLNRRVEITMTKGLRALFIGLLSAIFCAGCDVLRVPVAPGSVLFQDDFSRSSSGWDRYQDEVYLTDYYDDGYRIFVRTPETDAWANPGLDLENVQIEVDAKRLAGPEDNILGVLCRYQDSKNYYYFLISSDGYAGIGIYKDGRRRLLTGENLQPSLNIAKGDAVNHIRADCDGYSLRLWVNGALVYEAQAAEWSQGDVGLIAGTYEQGGTDILFDNFSVILPSQGSED